jgi:hypothetical protein
MKYIICILLLLFSSCAQGPRGYSMPGTPGQNGVNGKSVVSTGAGYTCDPNTCYCPSGSGVVETFYQDEAGLGYYEAGDTELNSILVCNGLTGSTGQTGATGSTGASGTNATPVTVVQFCPNDTVYPTTFSEVAFCVDNKLYAVYSLNGGFMSNIPDGTYSSDGVNSSCTFTVTGCIVN